MRKPLRLTLICASFAAAFAVLAPMASAGSATYYVAPTGAGTECTQGTPCQLQFASGDAVNEDQIVVEPGTYSLAGELAIFEDVDIGGRPGAPVPVIKTTGGSVRIGSETKAVLHDLRIEGTGGLVLNSARAERVFVAYAGISSSACSMAPGGTMVDSICWAHNPTSSTAAMLAGASNEEGTATLRNVTLIAVTDGGAGLYGSASSNGVINVNAVNVIARSSSGKDVRTEFSGFSQVHVTLASSDYSVLAEFPPFTTVTAAGTNGNLTAPPSFVNPAAGDFTQAAGSPTIGTGVNDPLNGATDLLGNPRSLATCIGGPAITDIGAYELVPTVACPVPASLSPSNRFTLGKLTLNRKTGTATLAVGVPGAGKFTLSGKGVRKVSRSAKGAAKLKLPVKPVGKWKQNLLATGKLKIALKLKFVPTGGSAAQKSKKTTLKENVR